MAKKEPDALSHITLAPGQPEVEVPTTRLGAASSVFLLRGIVHPVLPDDSREEGIGETLAQSLIAAGRCVPCGPKGGIYSVETPVKPDDAKDKPGEGNQSENVPAAPEDKPAAE